jgi:two-component system response regulator PilR (NtrC family)
MKKGLKILVVDDESVMQDMLGDILSQQGCSVERAGSADEALALLDKDSFDILLSDVKMPKKSGFELLKAVKDKHPDMGVVTMTAYSEAFTMKDAILLGADEYITKPFKIQEISLILERVYWRMLSRKKKKEAEQN